MTKSVAVAVEGPRADRALHELLALPGIQGSANRAEQGGIVRDGGLLVAIGAIVGIVGGITAVVSSIIEWRDRWNKSADTARLSVVIEDGKGNRFSLDNATPEQIAAALQTINH